VLSVVEVPKHGDTVLSSGGSERTIGGNGDGVDVTGVSVVVGSELALGELPDLDAAEEKEGKEVSDEVRKEAEREEIGVGRGIRDLGDKIILIGPDRTL